MSENSLVNGVCLPTGSVAENPYRSPAAQDAVIASGGESAATPPATEPRWGFWATAGFGLAVTVAFAVLQTAVVIAFVVTKIAAANGKIDVAAAAELGSNGLLLGLATLVSVPPSVGLIALFAKLKRGATLRSYLALQGVSPRVAGTWIGLTFVYVAAADGFTFSTGRPIVPPFMVDAYTTAQFVPLLWISLVVLAPLFEELFFRGFLLEGFRRSPLGPFGGVALTSLAWAVMHLQYDAFYIGIIFVCGLFLGAARLRTGSTSLTIAMHALMNLVATLEAVVYLHGNEIGAG
jgi:membrane protease YdiL (CAAX protease family)